MDRLQPDTTIKIQYYGEPSSSSAQSPPPRYILGYWSTKCLAAPLRRMLDAAQVDYWNVLYDVKETDGGWDKESYFRDKTWLKADHNPLINLPFLIDVERAIVISQTAVISRYLGVELDMYGGGTGMDIEIAFHRRLVCDELLHELMDLSTLLTDFSYGTDPSQKDASDFLDRATYSLEKLEGHLQREYLTAADDDEDDVKKNAYLLRGDTFASPDFHCMELLDQIQHVCRRYHLFNIVGPESADYPQLAGYSKLTALHPAMVSYKNSFCGRELPFNNPYAGFGSDPISMHYQRGQATPWHGKGVIEVHRTKL
eukprot:scaffold103442_cov52-Attheya_sp.AAC.3